MERDIIIIIIETERNNFVIGGFRFRPLPLMPWSIQSGASFGAQWTAFCRTRAAAKAAVNNLNIGNVLPIIQCAQGILVPSSTTYHGFGWNANDDAAGTQMRLGWLSTPVSMGRKSLPSALHVSFGSWVFSMRDRRPGSVTGASCKAIASKCYRLVVADQPFELGPCNSRHRVCLAVSSNLSALLFRTWSPLGRGGHEEVPSSGRYHPRRRQHTPAQSPWPCGIYRQRGHQTIVDADCEVRTRADLINKLPDSSLALSWREVRWTRNGEDQIARNTMTLVKCIDSLTRPWPIERLGSSISVPAAFLRRLYSNERRSCCRGRSDSESWTEAPGQSRRHDHGDGRRTEVGLL
jgi:hypothetical protein